MDFFTLLESRRSIRMYASQEIEPDKLEKILTAANRAPSAGNLQAYEIILVRSPAVKHQLAQAALDQGFLVQAPVVLAFCANPDLSAVRYADRGRTLYCLQDATIACAYAQLAAPALGLASVWVGAYHDEAVRQALGISTALIPVALLPVGYPAEASPARSRRLLSDLVHELK